VANGDLPGIGLVVTTGVLTPVERRQLRAYSQNGGKVVVVNPMGWEPKELMDWFGIRSTSQTTEAGSLWPTDWFFSPSGRPIQICGSRSIYEAVDSRTTVMAYGSAHPTAAIGFDISHTGFAGDDWVWCGSSLARWAPDGKVLERFKIPGEGVVAPTAAASGDFSGNGFHDDLIVASKDLYWLCRGGSWSAALRAPSSIRHLLSFPNGGPIWTLLLFLGDGSMFIPSFDGGNTFGEPQPFAPGGYISPSDFGYSFDYNDRYGQKRTGINLWYEGTFYTNFGDGWSDVSFVPELGPRYAKANIVVPTLGYVRDPYGSGMRNDLTLFVGSNLYSPDPETGGYTFPIPFHECYGVDHHPLIVQKENRVALLFDFHTTIRQLQQGRPIRHSSLMMLLKLSQRGLATPFTPVINGFDDWVDYNNSDIPQADMHERILRQIIMMLSDHPVPRIWYFPNGYHSVASMSHDVETAGAGQEETVRRATMEIGKMAFQRDLRNTFFILMTTDLGMMTHTDIQTLLDQSHSVNMHFDSLGSTQFSPYAFQLQADLLRALGPETIAGNRNHGLAWLGDDVLAALEKHPETIYDSTFGGGPGYSHCNSVLPYRLYQRDGQAIESFYEISHGLMDVADMKFYFSGTVPRGALRMDRQALFERARIMTIQNHRYYHGVFDFLLHPVSVAGLVPPIPVLAEDVARFADFLKSNHIPTMTLDEVALWWQSRRKVQLNSIVWEKEKILKFTLVTDQPVKGLTVIIPAQHKGKEITTISNSEGGSFAFVKELIEGRQVVFVEISPLEGAMDVVAAYA
jgi:hypothetical protein